MWAEISFVLSQCSEKTDSLQTDRHTDGRTDRKATAIPCNFDHLSDGTFSIDVGNIIGRPNPKLQLRDQAARKKNKFRLYMIKLCAKFRKTVTIRGWVSDD